MSTNFGGRVAIVTGAASGIGLETCRLFAKSSAKVFGVDISPLKDEELKGLTSGNSPNFFFHQTDVSNPEAADEIVKACLSQFGGRIDILANVAGVMDSFSGAATLREGELDKCLNINLKAPIALMGAVLPKMVEQKSGSIINISSKAGHSGGAAGLSYTASKWGLIGASKSTAFRYREDGIRCNVVAPGGVATSIMQNSGIMTADFQPIGWDMEGYQKTAAFGAIGHNKDLPPMAPQSVASAIAFLASDLSVDITGVVLPVDKGWSAV